MNDFQKSFLARGTGSTLYTQKEFDDQLAIAKAQIMQVAIETTKTAIAIEREECAKICDAISEKILKERGGLTGESAVAEECATVIRERITGKKKPSGEAGL